MAVGSSGMRASVSRATRRTRTTRATTVAPREGEAAQRVPAHELPQPREDDPREQRGAPPRRGGGADGSPGSPTALLGSCRDPPHSLLRGRPLESRSVPHQRTIDPVSRPFQKLAPARRPSSWPGGRWPSTCAPRRSTRRTVTSRARCSSRSPSSPPPPPSSPRTASAVIVYCSDGIRSHRAARRMAEAGVENLHLLEGGLRAWSGPLAHDPSPPAGPSPWLVAHASLAPPGARALDVACGRGRHALFLAAAGSMVRAVDRDPARVDRLNTLARRLRLPLDAAVAGPRGRATPTSGSPSGS